MIHKLFTEYAESLGFDLCFQNFDKELAGLPGDYSAPEGRLILAFHNKKPAGCVALRKLSKKICEMKRLYVRNNFRGKGIGRILAEKIIEEAGNAGYKRMRLDTTPKMKEAIKLYKSLGFKKIKPYTFNPIKGALYMELRLG
ncbi:MAG: GNAT family N-acetyltransferase [Ignavibacteria bacterium]